MYQFGAPVPITETKAASDYWEVTGYASVYDVIDLGNDMVRPGAFDRYIKSGAKTRFFYSHRPDKVLGTFTERKSTQKGLLVTGRISKTPLGEEVYTLIQDGALDSLSIGYVTQDSEVKDGVRHLKDLDLPEVSLVALPMLPQATLTAWKDWLSLFEVNEGEGEHPSTLVEKAQALAGALEQLFSDLRDVSHVGERPLNQSKRQEVEALLETFSGLDDVRSSFTQLLQAAQPARLAEQWQLRHRLAELETILKEAG